MSQRCVPSAKPIIGVTTHVTTDDRGVRRFELRDRYLLAVQGQGAFPVCVPPIMATLDDWLERVDGWVLTGGDDPAMEPFGQPTHPAATVIDTERQQFELELLRRLRALPDTPVLGICLGMQLMALSAGGMIDQHLPDHFPHADLHRNDNRHLVHLACRPRWLMSEPAPVDEAFEVTSWHHQAVTDAGGLRVMAMAPDGVIEAIDDPGRRFYVGVQWHPERSASDDLSRRLLRALVDACLPETS